MATTEKLEFVDDLPPRRTVKTGPSAITQGRMEAMKGMSPKWLRWPTRSSAGTVLKALGPGFEAQSRSGVIFARWAPEGGATIVTETGGGGGGGGGTAVIGINDKLLLAKCARCKRELGNAVDPDTLVQVHLRAKPICAKWYRENGM